MDPKSEQSAASPGVFRVLIVDDEPAITSSLRRALSGYEVHVAHSGREALALCEAEWFDCILCDLMMPDLTGMDFHAQRQRSNPGSETRIVFMTGGAFTPRSRDFVASRSNSCLEKPFTTDAVRTLVKAVCSLPR